MFPLLLLQTVPADAEFSGMLIRAMTAAIVMFVAGALLVILFFRGLGREKEERFELGHWIRFSVLMLVLLGSIGYLLWLAYQ